MILDLMLLVICISGFEHCGISLSSITRPTLHYKLSFTVIYVTSKVVLMCKRVTPRYHSRSSFTAGVLRYKFSARRRASSPTRYRGPLSGIPAPFFMTFIVLVSKGPVRDLYPKLSASP